MEQKNRNIWIAVIVVIVVLCCCAAAVAAVAASVIVNRVEETGVDLDIFELDTAASARVEQVFEAGDDPYLDIINFAGDVTIRAGEGNTIQIVATKRAARESALDRIYVDMTKERDQITVRTRKADSLGNANVELEIIAPPGTEISLRTGAGEIELRGITGSIDTRTGAGDIAIAAAAGPVQLATGAGGIQYEGTPAGRCSFETGAGDIRLRLPADADVRVDLGTGWGSIDVGYDVKGKSSTRSVTGVIGDGSQATIYAHTGVGSISARP